MTHQKNTLRILTAFILLSAIVFATRTASLAFIMETEGETDAAQPAQAETGPGGKDYPHADRNRTFFSTYFEGDPREPSSFALFAVLASAVPTACSIEPPGPGLWAGRRAQKDASSRSVLQA